MKYLFQKAKNNHNWAGNVVTYNTLHQWMNDQYGKATYCENRKHKILKFSCNRKSKIYDWAKKDGNSDKTKKYKRNAKYFFQLCRSCHWKYDMKNRKQCFQKGCTPWSKGKKIGKRAKWIIKKLKQAHINCKCKNHVLGRLKK